MCGTLAGGSLLDRMGSSMRNALLLCAGGTLAGSALAAAAFWGARSFPAFCAAFAAAELAMFASQVGCCWGGWVAGGLRVPEAPQPG